MGHGPRIRSPCVRVHVSAINQPCIRLDCCFHLGFPQSEAEGDSSPVYLADPSQICVERVIELLHLGCVALNSRSSPSSDRGFCDRGWKFFS